MKVLFLGKKGKRKVCIVIIIAFVFCLFLGQMILANQNQNNKNKLVVSEKEYKDFILAFLNPYISDALEQHYGYQKNFDLFNTKILKIEDHTMNGYYFDITLLVNSYIGAHLLDFSNDIITFRLDDKGINLNSFKDYYTFPGGGKEDNDLIYF